MAKQKKNRVSGRPGDGAGRRDEVGKGGVYPISGPLPEGDAPIVQQGALGHPNEELQQAQESHGGSELSYNGGLLLGGLTSGPGGAPEGESHELQNQERKRQINRAGALKQRRKRAA
jgi:hypothetical protein